MIRQRSWFTAAGALALAAGLGFSHWTHGHYGDLIGGFLIGVSIALMILGLARPSRQTSR